MKRRLDVLLAERGLAPSRTAAQALVMAGKVRVDGYQDVSRRVKVDPKQSLEVNIRLPRVFTPDTEVETTHGTYRGVLVSSSPEGLTLEIRPGITQTIPQGDIRRKTPISQ